MMSIKELFEHAEANLKRAEAEWTHNDVRASFARTGDGFTRLAEARMKAMKDGFQQ